MNSSNNPDFADKDYEATFEVLMPGNAKTTAYKIAVRAAEPIEATAKAIDEWKNRTAPTDVRVKEIKSKVSGRTPEVS